MAEKSTKKAPVKDDKTIHEQLVEKRNDLKETRKSLASGELVNPRVIKSHRKDIARLLTKINAQKEAK